MKKSCKTLLLFFALGAAFWLVDGVVDYLAFYRQRGYALSELLFTHVPAHEVYARLTVFAVFGLAGALIARILGRQAHAEAALRERTAQLGERHKELGCLYRMAEVVEQPGATLEEILQGTADAIPPAWQFPEVTCAEVVLHDRTFRTANYDEPNVTPERTMRENLVVNGECVGHVAVCYTEARPAEQEGPFLAEERSLLKVVAERLGRIVERMQAVESLRRSRRRFRAIVEQAPFPLMAHAEDGEVLALSRAFVELTGYGREEISTLGDWTRRAYGERRGQVGRAIGKLYELSERRDEGEFQVTCADGSVRIWDFSSAPLPPLPDGRRVVISMAADVTERERARARIQQLNALLKTINEVNQLIVREQDRDRLLEQACRLLVAERDFSYAWIALVDDQGRALAMAHAGLAGQEHALQADLEAGNLPFCARRVTEEGRTYFHEDPALCEGCPVGTAHGPDWPVTLRLEHAGKVLGALSVCMPENMRADEEELGLLEELSGDLALALHNIDLSRERDRLERQLRQAQKLQAVGQLAGGVAHDFNNILTGVLGYVQLALGADDLPEHLRRDLEEVERLGKRAAELTGQLLAFSRRQALEPQVVNVNRLVEDMAKMLDRLLGEHIELEFRPAESLDHVHVDPGQIEQVIMNLAVNARDAMPEGGVLTIETSNVELEDEYARNHVGVSPGPYVQIAVSDTGSGMDAETRARAFEPFFTTKAAGAGTGLGLSTCYGIVKQHGGNIWVYSEPGAGTTFKVYLPRSERQPASHARAQVAGERGTETILVVEDEPSVLSIAGRILSDHGYEILCAEDATSGREVFEQHMDEIDLLLTDVILPDINGRELYMQLRELRPDLKVLYMSGYTDNAIVHHGVLEEGVHFMQKPFTPAQVARRVRQALEEE